MATREKKKMYVRCDFYKNEIRKTKKITKMKIRKLFCWFYAADGAVLISKIRKDLHYLISRMIKVCI